MTLRTILEELVKEITMQPFLSTGAKDEITNAEQKIKELMLGEEDILDVLVYISWSSQRDGKNNLIGKEQLKLASIAIHLAMLKKLEE